MNEISSEILRLFEKRNELRASKNFAAADKIRIDLLQKGYFIEDHANGSTLVPVSNTAKKQFVAIFGSGETTAVGQEIHNVLFREIGLPRITIALLATPAGFQPNVTVVMEEIATFFRRSLQNYHPSVTIIYANTAADANSDTIIEPITTADYIFIGPGSPTYAIRNLRNTKLLQLLLQRFSAGASIGIASAAAIAFSQFALPVYEIYKAGSDLYWENGLSVYNHLYKPISIIPHYNNTDGGAKNDTSRCFMGKRRFAALQKLLPPTAAFIGIDEQTALVIDCQTKEERSLGNGNVHVMGGY